MTLGRILSLGCLWGLAATGLAPGSARADIIDHAVDFSSSHGTGGDIAVNGSATVGAAVRLTDTTRGNEAGSAFMRRPVTIAGGFVTEFTVLLAPSGTNSYGDGITFTLQSAGAAALGNPGGDLGYGGMAASASYAIKLDTYQNPGDPSDSSFGIFRNGAAPVGGTSLYPTIDLHDRIIRVHVVYLPLQHTVRASVADDANRQWVEVTDSVDLAALFGGNQATVGFTAGTGASVGTQSVLTWSFSSAPAMVLTDLGTLRNRGSQPGTGSESAAYDVNDFGQVVGASRLTMPDPSVSTTAPPDVAAVHGFVWDAMSHPWGAGVLMHEIGTPAYASLGMSYAYGINNQGTVVGAATICCPTTNPLTMHTSCTNVPHAFSLDFARVTGAPMVPRNLGLFITPASAAPQYLGYVAASSTVDTSVATGINDAGQIVGFSSAQGGNPLNPPPELQQHAFLGDGRTLLDLTPASPLYLQSMYAFRINAWGQIVGFDPSIGQTALWQPSSVRATSGSWYQLFSDYSDGSNRWGGAALNGLGEVVGLTSDYPAADLQLDLWTPSAANAASGSNAVAIPGHGYGMELDTPFTPRGNGLASAESYEPTVGINDAGQVVGQHDGHANLFMRAPAAVGGGVAVALDDLVAGGLVTAAPGQSFAGWALSRATAINNVGQIVGYATVNGSRRAFLLTPATTAVVNTVSPSRVDLGRAVTLDLQGRGFLRDSQVQVNGQTLANTVLSPTHIQVSLAPGDLRGGSNAIAVYNPSAGTLSDPASLLGVFVVPR